MRMIRWVTVAGLLAVASAVSLSAQSTWQPAHQGLGFAPAQDKQSVQLASSTELTVPTGRKDTQQLRFLIAPGLHINSHTPKSHFLVPTTLTLDAPPGVQIAGIEYPAGVEYHFAFAPNDPLSVYTSDFAVGVDLHAKPGRYTLHGQLHYQACDNRACNPPKTLPVTLDVTAR